MATSKLPDVIAALVSILDAAAALDGVTVFDGPRPTSADDRKILAIGHTDDEGNAEAGNVQQTWAGLGAQAKNETGMVECVVITQDGTTDTAGLRVQAYAVVSAVETTLRLPANLTLGGVIQSGWAHLSAGRLRQHQMTSGAVVRVNFTVSYQARI